MVEEQKHKLTFLGIFPKCPFYKPVNQLFVLAAIAFGTWGIYYLNLWVAVAYLIYAILYFYFAMPVFHCRFCYYKVKETSASSKKGKSVKTLLPLAKWKESYLDKHVKCGKTWGFNFFIILFVPIILIIVSFIVNTSAWMFELIALIGFLIMVGLLGLYMKKKTCANCAIQEDCHSSF